MWLSIWPQLNVCIHCISVSPFHSVCIKLTSVGGIYFDSVCIKLTSVDSVYIYQFLHLMVFVSIWTQLNVCIYQCLHLTACVSIYNLWRLCIFQWLHLTTCVYQTDLSWRCILVKDQSGSSRALYSFRYVSYAINEKFTNPEKSFK